METRDNSTSLMYFGMTLGLLVAYLSKKPITLETVCFFGVITILTVRGKFFDFLRLTIITSIILLYIGQWSLGNFKWYEPILLVWFGGSIIYTLFGKVEKPVFVNENDVTTFPPVFVPETYHQDDIDYTGILKGIVGDYDSKTGRVNKN